MIKSDLMKKTTVILYDCHILTWLKGSRRVGSNFTIFAPMIKQLFIILQSKENENLK